MEKFENLFKVFLLHAGHAKEQRLIIKAGYASPHPFLIFFERGRRRKRKSSEMSTKKSKFAFYLYYYDGHILRNCFSGTFYFSHQVHLTHHKGQASSNSYYIVCSWTRKFWHASSGVAWNQKQTGMKSFLPITPFRHAIKMQVCRNSAWTNFSLHELRWFFISCIARSGIPVD